MATPKYNFKIVLLGEGCVGKTSLVLRYCQNAFNDKHIATLQASFLTKKLNIGGKRVELAIWDTAGQERFHALGPIYYRDSNGALLVFDITDEDSFQKVQKWVKELRKMLGAEIPLLIAGNKCDLDKNRHVSVEEAESYAKSVGAIYIETSAKLNRNVETVFLELSKSMLANVKEDDPDAASKRTKKGLVISDEDVKPEEGGKCCWFRPVPLKLYDPMVDLLDRRERVQRGVHTRKDLQQEHRKATRQAIKAIRADTRFLQSAREAEWQTDDDRRTKRYNQIISELQEQRHMVGEMDTPWHRRRVELQRTKAVTAHVKAKEERQDKIRDAKKARKETLKKFGRTNLPSKS